MCKSVGVILLLLPAVFAIPAQDELMMDLGDDTAVVESTVREARAAVPSHIDDLLQPGVKEAFLHSYGDEEGADGDEQGYRKKTQDKGSDGYKHYDSYHKKDGDKYGYKTHTEYGQKTRTESNTGKGKSGKNGADKAETKKNYQVVENQKEGKKAVEDYEGDSGYYADSGDAEGEVYTEGGEGGEYYEGGEGGEGEGGHYVESEGDGESYTEYDEGESYSEGDDYY